MACVKCPEYHELIINTVELGRSKRGLERRNGWGDEVLSTLRNNPFLRKWQGLTSVLRVSSGHRTNTGIGTSLTDDGIESGDFVVWPASEEIRVVCPSWIVRT